MNAIQLPTQSFPRPGDELNAARAAFAIGAEDLRHREQAPLPCIHCGGNIVIGVRYLAKDGQYAHFFTKVCEEVLSPARLGGKGAVPASKISRSNALVCQSDAPALWQVTATPAVWTHPDFPAQPLNRPSMTPPAPPTIIEAKAIVRARRAVNILPADPTVYLLTAGTIPAISKTQIHNIYSLCRNVYGNIQHLDHLLAKYYVGRELNQLDTNEAAHLENTIRADMALLSTQLRRSEIADFAKQKWGTNYTSHLNMMANSLSNGRVEAFTYATKAEAETIYQQVRAQLAPAQISRAEAIIQSRKTTILTTQQAFPRSTNTTPRRF